MFVHHRFVLGAGVVGAGIAVAIGLHAAASSPPAAGASFSWAAAPSATATPIAGTLPGAPIPTASPSPSQSSEPLGGLRLPLSKLFQQLNTETENTAVGQFSILRDIGDAIRDRVLGFLHWVSGGR